MTAPLLLDLSHTSHSQARTGIQRVARSLYTALRTGAVAITHDPYAGTWRELDGWEKATLAATGVTAGGRGARWPIHTKIRGRLQHWFGNKPAICLPSSALNGGLLVPEVFSPAAAAALPALLAATRGPRVALFHDAIALKFPELTPLKTVARFPGYLQELLVFDGIAAVSEDSRQSLLEYWRWLGVNVAEAPPVQAIPLGVELTEFHLISEILRDARPPIVLSVGSIEGRKNHIALLDAAEQLWAAGKQFELRLIGLAHPLTGRPALERVHALQAARRPLRYDGPVDDATLDAAYAACAFTVYPSLSEGFGLPVLESLARGKPCICSARGALGESARGGGCLTLAIMDIPSLAAGIDLLLSSKTEYARHTAEARARTFKSWIAYARELAGWLQTLPRRGKV
ncbi:MAG: glycosyltransferase family 1 protein [Opitutaceae bacterium]|nr:glycosyltransferase family 1 protein [Opitutaceae bacterium]